MLRAKSSRDVPCGTFSQACKKFKRVEGRPEHAAAEGVLVQNFDPRCPLDCSFYRMAIKGSVCKTDSPLAYRSLVERTPQALYDPHPESITWDPGRNTAPARNQFWGLFLGN